MRRALFILVILICPTLAFSGISGSSHDFSSAIWACGKICAPCHTSHNGIKTTAAPLWSRNMRNVTYRVYSSDSMVADVEQPSGVSKLCLSCHDGITALDSFGKNRGSVSIKGKGNLGIDLGTHHPVSFVYNSALAAVNKGLKDPVVSSSGLGGTIARDLLSKQRVECTSCHDVHNEKGDLLSITNSAGSTGLCLVCHTKVWLEQLRTPKVK